MSREETIHARALVDQWAFDLEHTPEGRAFIVDFYEVLRVLRSLINQVESLEDRLDAISLTRQEG